MKKKILPIVVCLFICATFFISRANAAKTPSAAKPKPCKFLTYAEAEKILGQSVRLIENVSKIEGDVSRTDCVYTGFFKDKVSGKDINLYFSMEQKAQNPTVEEARQVFESAYRKINEPDLSVQVLSEIGDESFLISNLLNFHFIMVRKNAIIFRIKLNKAAENTSLAELKIFAKEFAEQL